MINIDKDVPIPKDASKGRPKYPFAEMEVGHSFYIGLEESGCSPAKLYSQLYSAIRKRQLTYAEDYIMRREGTGYRTWRIK